MARLSTNNYGKSLVRLVKIARGDDADTLFDVTVQIVLEGNFEDAYREGDNALILPTDTMKNTVYGLAAQHEVGSPEALARLLANHFVDTNPQEIVATVNVEEKCWQRRDGFTFTRAATGEKRLASARREGDALTLSGGLDDLRVLRTRDTAFADFLTDRYTTLPPTEDRVLQTEVTAHWAFADARADHDFGQIADTAREGMLDLLATHDSKSVQHTLYAMGERVLADVEAITEIDIRMPNIHCLRVDLEPFDLDNPPKERCEIFLSTDEPHGDIWATVARD